MKTELILQDYFGNNSFLEAHSDKELTVFIVDDNPVFLKLVKHLLKEDRVTILTFSSAEECLNALDLEPDIVITDFHLDGKNKDAMPGDELAAIIESKLPETEVFIISADKKFRFISHLKNSFGEHTLYKDGASINLLKSKVHQSWVNKFERLEYQRIIKNVILVFLILVFIVFLTWHILKIQGLNP